MPPLTTDDKALLRRRLLLFFRKYSPSRLVEISDLIDATKAGTVAAAMSPFVKEYGPEPAFYQATKQERADLEKRLTDFYNEHEPAKLSSVPTLVTRYLDMPDELFDALGKKYRPAETAETAKKRTEALDAFKQQLREEFTARCPEKLSQLERLAAEYVDYQSTLLDEIRNTYPVLPTSNAGEQPAAGSSSNASDADTDAAASPPLTTTITWRDRVIRMYSRYQPDKLPSVDGLMIKYAGMEAQMLSALVSKYGPEPGPELESKNSSIEGRIRVRLERYFKFYNEEKVASIPQIMKAFEGEWDALWEALTAKYGPESAVVPLGDEAVASSAAPPTSSGVQGSATAQTQPSTTASSPPPAEHAAVTQPQESAPDASAQAAHPPPPSAIKVETVHAPASAEEAVLPIKSPGPQTPSQAAPPPEGEPVRDTDVVVAPTNEESLPPLRDSTPTSGGPSQPPPPPSAPQPVDTNHQQSRATTTVTPLRPENAGQVSTTSRKEDGVASTAHHDDEAAAADSAQQQQPSQDPETEALKRRIERVFDEHDPAKLPSLPGILKKYSGMERELLRAVIQKYCPGEESTEAALHAPHQTAQPANTDDNAVVVTAREPPRRSEAPAESIPVDEDEDIVTLPPPEHQPPTVGTAEEDTVPLLLDESEDPIAVEENTTKKISLDGATMRQLDELIASYFPGEGQQILRLCVWNAVVKIPATPADRAEAALQALLGEAAMELQRHRKVVLTLLPTLSLLPLTSSSSDSSRSNAPIPPRIACACRIWKFLKFDISALDDGVTMEGLLSGLDDLWNWCNDEDMLMDLLVALSGREETHNISGSFLNSAARKVAAQLVTQALDEYYSSQSGSGTQGKHTTSSLGAVAFFMRVHDLDCVAEELVKLLQHSASSVATVTPGQDTQLRHRDPLHELKASEGWRDRVVRMLRHHAPGRVNTADALVRAFRGDEPSLMKKLQQLYGAEPPVATFTDDQRQSLRDHLLWLYRRSSTSEEDSRGVEQRVNAVMAAYYGAEDTLYELVDNLPQPVVTASSHSTAAPAAFTTVETEEEEWQDSTDHHETSTSRDAQELSAPVQQLLWADEDRLRSALEMEEYNVSSTLRSHIRCLVDEATMMDWVRRTAESRRRVMASESSGYLYS